MARVEEVLSAHQAGCLGEHGEEVPKGLAEDGALSWHGAFLVSLELCVMLRPLAQQGANDEEDQTVLAS